MPPTDAGLTEDEAAELRRLIVSSGLERTATDFAVNTTTLLRAAVGLPLHRATRTVIQIGLQNGTKETQG
jgi:hypothetical protein